MKLPLHGVRILDMTGVQAGPAATQMLAWLGADVLKIERVGEGDITRRQLRDIEGVDALYFTQLNGNKRSMELNPRTPEGKEILEKLVKEYDVLIENFGPGALDRMGFSWERLQELNPAMIFGSIKGFEENSRYNDLKVYENVAQCAGGSASVTGWWDGPPLVAGTALGDSNTGMHLCIGIISAVRQRDKSGKGQKVMVSMQATNINLNRVKLRDQLRLEATGVLEEYPQNALGLGFGEAVPRGGNAGGGGQPGWVLKCKGWEDDPNAYIYMTIQGQNWKRTAEAIGKPEWADDPEYASAQARLPKVFDIFKYIEDNVLKDRTKDEAVDYLRQFDIPVAPVKSMKEIAYDEDLRESGTIVEVDHKHRGKYLTVGNPIKFSAFDTEVKESPMLGEHTRAELESIGYTKEQIDELMEKNVVGENIHVKLATTI